MLDDARRAADAGEWDRFVHLMRGPGASRRDHPVDLAKAWSDEPGRYGEPKGYVTFGVQADGVTVTTRVHAWTVDYAASGGSGGEGRPAPAAAGF